MFVNSVPVGVSEQPEPPTSTCQKRKVKQVTIGTWNIRRGLVKRENEIITLLFSENLDVLFLTETDTQFSNTCSYNINKTVI